MDNTWEGAALLQHKETQRHAPEYIEKNAADRSDPMGAEYLGRKYHHFTGALEKFYSTAYKMAPSDRATFCGRGRPCHCEEQQLKGRGDRRH
eukprot:1029967-Pyramimonas_sp.AAC.1